MKPVSVIFFGLLLLCDSVLSQESKVPADTLRPDPLDEVVISASRGEETRRTVAQQVQVLGVRQIEEAQARTTADLLSNTAGVFVQRSQMGGGSPVLRGFEASRILLVVDGVRLNNLIYRSGHLQNILTLDNNSLERMEILFGPASTVYGSDALGGVIHLYTKAPRFAADDTEEIRELNAFTRFGTVNDERTAHVDFSIGDKKWASFTSLTGSDFSDLRGGTTQNPFYGKSYGEREYYAQRIDGRDSVVRNTDRYLQIGTAYSQYDIVQKFAFRPSDNVIHSINVQHSNSSDIPRYDRLTDSSSTIGLRFAEWFYGPQTRWLAAYDIHMRRPGRFFDQLHVMVNYQNITESRHQRTFDDLQRQSRNENVGVWGGGIDLKHVSSAHVLHAGIDAQYNTLRSTAYSENIETGLRTPLDTRYPDGGNTMGSVSAWLSHTWKINPTTTLTDGFRVGFSKLYAEFRDTTFFNFPEREVRQEMPVYSGSIGLIHIPNNDLKFSMLLGTGFRVPNIDDLAKVFESQPGSVILPNPDLRPEKTVSTELGITKIYNGVSTWENTVYFTQFLNAIAVDNYRYQGNDTILYNGVPSRVLAAQNRKRAYLYGFSSTYRTRLLEDLEFSLNMNYTYGRFRTDSSDVPMDHIPPFQCLMGLRYANQRFSAGFTVQYNGWKRIKDYYLNGEDNERYATPDGMPAWFCVNLRTSYRISARWNVQAGIDNVFDTQYRVFASGINAPGRNVFGTLRYTIR
ncbi:MAG: hypothetical protein RLZZ630_348 [Bacteroidota bacterium]|jgi:hemoglobin/transferrin/lactoferrin receptor protein